MAEAALAKNTAVSAAEHVAYQAVQIFGGMGYMRESEVARMWLDARVARIWAGSNEIMREVIGRSLLA
jgi:acyl-CoA dehydrogenase